MEIIKGTREFSVSTPTAVAIGKFDGVHLGHKRLLEEILAKKEDGLLACVFTFHPSPAKLFGFSDGRELTDVWEKRMLLENMGVDLLIEFPLDFESAAMLPEDFIREILADRLKASFIAAGDDLSFGKGGLGNRELLERMAPDYGYEVKCIEKITAGGEEISSSRIRDCIMEGRVEAAEAMLGRPYRFYGEVEHGRALGRTLGFPTANIRVPQDKVLPMFGVYAARVLTPKGEYEAVCNIGTKPTVQAENQVGVEAYLYDFDGDLYGDPIIVELLHFRRPEMRFASVEELRAQVEQDKLRH